MDKQNGPFQLPPLPWNENALEPVISARTISFHYGKHHAAYVKKANELVAGTRFEAMPLERIIVETAGHPDSQKLFNQAAQAWNHTFFWHCLKPAAARKPAGELARKIDADLGGFDKFREAFIKAAVECFGSGWAWLADRNGKLEIIAMPNAGTPLANGATPLLTIDVWEHAYYLDYQNERPKFVTAVFDQLLDWNFAAEQLEKGRSQNRKAA
jgi:superoxide dismutase, Fe-Mn family